METTLSKDTATQEQDFESAFAEFSGAPSAGDPPAETPEVELAQESGVAQEPEQGSSVVSADKAKPDEGVKKTPEEELAEMRTLVADLQHRERSASGRISLPPRQPLQQAMCRQSPMTPSCPTS